MDEVGFRGRAGVFVAARAGAFLATAFIRVTRFGVAAFFGFAFAFEDTRVVLARDEVFFVIGFWLACACRNVTATRKPNPGVTLATFGLEDVVGWLTPPNCPRAKGCG